MRLHLDSSECMHLQAAVTVASGQTRGDTEPNANIHPALPAYECENYVLAQVLIGWLEVEAKPGVEETIDGSRGLHCS